MSTTELRNVASGYRTAAAALVKQADFLEAKAAEVDGSLAGLETLLSGFKLDLSDLKLEAKSKPVKEGKKRGRPAGVSNKAKDKESKESKENNKERAHYKTSLRELIVKILKDKSNGGDLAMVVTECIKRGYKSSVDGEKFTRIVYQTLQKLVNEEASVEKDTDRKYHLVKVA